MVQIRFSPFFEPKACSTCALNIVHHTELHVDPARRSPLMLHTQYPTPAPASTKIRLSILATALVDALGGPAEFHERSTFPFITSMMPNKNFNLPRAVWTDDTSMMLCLARSLATFNPARKSRSQSGSGNQSGAVDGRTPSPPPAPLAPGGFDEKDQLDAYARWFEKGVLSATGHCFDIGNTIRQALSIYNRLILRHPKSQTSWTIDEVLAEIGRKLGGEYSAGNGSLMRVLPVGLAYWSRGDEEAREYAKRSSRTTHPNLVCQEACEVWTGAIVRIMKESVQEAGHAGRTFSKLDLLDYFAQFPYKTKLREVLAFPAGTPPSPAAGKDKEKYYETNHPVLRLITKTLAEKKPRDGFRWPIPSPQVLPSSGYVVHTLVAALYCFLATETFEEGAILAVNLGNDADTVGAVYGGLAGCWYAGEEIHGGDVFWTKSVKEWRSQLMERSLVEEVAEELVGFASRQV
jgi:ADP-ribosyl-[dinitrogen reductase] hydrolase